MPTKSDSDALLCLQLLSITLSCTLHLSLRELIYHLCINPILRIGLIHTGYIAYKSLITFKTKNEVTVTLGWQDSKSHVLTKINNWNQMKWTVYIYTYLPNIQGKGSFLHIISYHRIYRSLTIHQKGTNFSCFLGLMQNKLYYFVHVQNGKC